MYVAGVDGCRDGWVVALLQRATGTTSLRVVGTFVDVLALPEAPVVIGVDMPIGLLEAAERGGRVGDRMARSLLGWPRRNSVFCPPVRAALGAKTFPLGCSANRASSPLGIGISQQCFHLFAKLSEVDDVMNPALQARVVEVHPELSFYEVAGGKPMAYGKKTGEGREERVNALIAAGMLPEGAQVPKLSGAASDDVLDALAACWTAQRVDLRQAVRVPDDPVVDARGLRMEIWR